MRNSEIELFIFDFGGVMRKGKDLFTEIFAKLGYEFKGFPAIGPHAAEANRKMSLGTISEPDFWKEVDKDLDKPTGFEYKFYDNKESYPVSGMTDIVSALKKNGYRVVVGTNIHKPYYDRNSDDGYYSIFDNRYSSCELHICKPDPQFFITIAERENVPLKNIMLIDDTLANVESALKLGMTVHHFTDPVTLASELKRLECLN